MDKSTNPNHLWSRRKVLSLGGAIALSPLLGLACSKAAAKKAAPWVGQFLVELAFELGVEAVADYIRNEPDRWTDVEKMMSNEGFTLDCLSAYPGSQQQGVANIYESDNYRAICRVMPGRIYETCIGFTESRGGKHFFLEGPVLAGLHGVTLLLRDAGMNNNEIANAIVPLWSHRLGDGLKFETPRADRRYRTGIGDMAVTWELTGERTGCAFISLPGMGTFDITDIPFTVDDS